jgi:HAMP domain-containing protein
LSLEEEFIMKKLTIVLMALAAGALTAQAAPVNNTDATISYAVVADTDANSDPSQNPNQDLAQAQDDSSQTADNSDTDSSNADLSSNDADSGAADDSDTN